MVALSGRMASLPRSAANLLGPQQTELAATGILMASSSAGPIREGPVMPTLAEWWQLLAWGFLFGFAFTVGAALASTLIGLMKRN